MAIPLAKPLLGKAETKAAGEAILSGWVTQGPRVKLFEEHFAAYVGSKHACAVSSCTTALHLALLAVGVKLGDVVITVSHSFIAAANSIRYCGAEPVFIDIDRETLNISPEHLKSFLQRECRIQEGETYFKDCARLKRNEGPYKVLFDLGISPRSKKIGRIAAIVVVHQIGFPCDLREILPIAKSYNIPLIEDAACAMGSQISFDRGSTWEKIGKPHGDIACFSFHPRKIITTGDGGMLTTNNTQYDATFRLLRQHGMNVTDLDRHKAKKVIFEQYLKVGFNYRMTDIQAAVGIEQLKRLPKILKEKEALSRYYAKKLNKIAWLKILDLPEHIRTNWQSYPVYVLKDAPLSRNDLMNYLYDRGVTTKSGIMNVHEQHPYQGSKEVLTQSVQANREVIFLPHYPGLTRQQIDQIVDLLMKIS